MTPDMKRARPVVVHLASPLTDRPEEERPMAQISVPEPASARRIVTLVIAGDDPMKWFAEFVNCMEEHEERLIIAALREHLPLFAACREIEEEQVP